MAVKKNGANIKVISSVLFVVMVIVNIIADTLPINGFTTGEVADSFPNLFAPAAVTFTIWGLIYLLLAGYTIYQLVYSRINNDTAVEKLFAKIGVYFSISSIANILWIFSWHYFSIASSMLLIIVILICLIIINAEIYKTELSLRDKIFIKLPFSVYFGWITVATIANAAILLTSYNWDGFGISEVTWTVIVILIGLLIALATMLKNKDFAYGLTVIWAYLGILIKHTSSNGFDGEYPAIIITVIVSMVILFLAGIYILVGKKKERD